MTTPDPSPQNTEIWALEPDEYPLAAPKLREPPKVFAIVELERAEENAELVDAQVLAWGLSFPGHAEPTSPDNQIRGRFHSAGSAMNLLSLTGEVRLVWQ